MSSKAKILQNKESNRIFGLDRHEPFETHILSFLPCFYDLRSDWDNLNCLRPHIVTRVTEHVDSHIVPFIEDLVKRGMAYELREGGDEDNGGAEDGVYFDVRAFQEKMGHMVSCDVLLCIYSILYGCIVKACSLLAA